MPTKAADSLRQRLVRALAGDHDIRARNSIYADRYRRFLHSWLPDAFPAPYDDVLIHVDDLNYLFDVNAPAIVRHERRLLRGGTVLLRAVRPRLALAGPIPSFDLPSAPTP
jgi:hypothetical protein